MWQKKKKLSTSHQLKLQPQPVLPRKRLSKQWRNLIFSQQSVSKKIVNDALTVIKKRGFWASNVSVDMFFVTHIDCHKITSASLIIKTRQKKNLKNK